MKTSSRSGVVVGSFFARLSLVGTLALAAGSSAMAGDFARVSSYRSKADSPFASPKLIVNDFETSDQTIGVLVVGPVSLVDGTSVDGDDASLDGAGTGGKSLQLGSYTPVFAPGSATFSYQSKILGGTPTNVGIVITSANGLEDIDGNVIDVPVTITIALADGTVVSEAFPVRSADDSALDDVFLGYSSAAGILSMSVQAEIPIKVDHLQIALPVQVTPISVRNDFDGDGKADVCWYNRAAGSASIWKMNGLVREAGLAASATLPPRSVVLGTTDLNNDQRADVIWQSPSTGVVNAWLMDGGSVIESGPIGPALAKAWKFLGAGDLDGDGNGDCVFRNSSTGVVMGWLMNGLTLVESDEIGPSAGLTFLGMGDFDGDRKQDLLWRAAGGRVFGWKLDGLSIATNQQVIGAPFTNSSWKVAGTGDLDGDGRDDVVLRRSSNGDVSGWIMNGLTVVEVGTISTEVPVSWTIVSVSDYDGDGIGDLLWRKKSSGDVYAWLMDGFAERESAFVRNAASAWNPIK